MELSWGLLVGLLALHLGALAQDTNFLVFLCFGQSNMEGFPGIEEQDKGPVDERFQVLAAVDFPKQGRTKGHWYPAVPPLCRPSAGLGPADYFGRTLVSNLPPQIRVGIVNVSIGGCKMELFMQDKYQEYSATAPKWMTNTIATYSGNPYQHLVEMAKLAQQDGIIKGILLHQGESNTNDKQWPAKVKGIYDNLLKDLNLKAEAVPLLAGELLGADQQGACASMNRIIAELPKTIPSAHVVTSEGCAGRLCRKAGSFAFHSRQLSGVGKTLRGNHAAVARFPEAGGQMTGLPQDESQPANNHQSSEYDCCISETGGHK